MYNGEKPAKGSVRVSGGVAAAGSDKLSTKKTPQLLGSSVLSKKKNFDALAVVGLADAKNLSVSDLSPSQLAACELLPCFTGDAKLLLIDGQLDRIDPWTLSEVLAALRRKLNTGCALVVVTNRPELLPQFDQVLLLQNQRPIYVGSTDGLLRKGPAGQVEIRSRMQPGVQALVERFCVGVTQKPDSTIYHAADGQHLAAKLLLEGYGDIRFVVERQPNHEEALMHLTKAPLKKLR